MKHKAVYAIERYPSSTFARKILYICTCGVKGSVSDGASAPTMKRARAAFQRHVNRANT